MKNGNAMGKMDDFSGNLLVGLHRKETRCAMWSHTRFRHINSA
jgi:hypothetical protein